MTKSTNTRSVKTKKYECIAASIRIDPSMPSSPFRGNILFIPDGYRGDEYKYTSIDICSPDVESITDSIVKIILGLDPDADPKALFEESDRILKEQQATAGKVNDETTMEQPRSSEKKPCEDQ